MSYQRIITKAIESLEAMELNESANKLDIENAIKMLKDYRDIGESAMARLKKYALYKGDELVAEGTIEQIATKMGLAQNAVRFYKTPSYKKRCNPENSTALVEADYYDKPEDFSDCFAWTGVFKTPCAALNVTFCDWENCKFYKRK